MALIAITDLAARVLAGPARCGGTRLVCIDGPSGSGKTSLAERIAAALGGAALLHMDHIYPGWDGLADAVPILHDQVVAPLAAGQAARYRRYDWVLGAFAEEHDLGTPPVLVVEGVSCGARVVAAYATSLLWVEAPREERFRRGMERDGESYRPHWERWARQEDAHFAAEGTRNRADLRLDGAPAQRYDRDAEVVLLPSAQAGPAVP